MWPAQRQGADRQDECGRNREIPAKFGIRGIPTLMLFKLMAQLAATKVGAEKTHLSAFLDQHI